MKLVEIEDVRIGHICNCTAIGTNGEELDVLYLIEDMLGEYNDNETRGKIFDAKTMKSIGSEDDWYIEDVCNSIGFLNITHKIEDNKLVKMAREEFEVDDVVEMISETSYDEPQYDLLGVGVIIGKNKILMCKPSFEILDIDTEYIWNKIGILGVTHEYINSKLEEK